MPPAMLKDTGSILRPFHSVGAKVLYAAGDVRMSITRGWAARISGVTCVSIRAWYSSRASSTDVSMKCNTSGPKAKGSGVSTSSGHSSGGFVQASTIVSIGKFLRSSTMAHMSSTDLPSRTLPYLGEWTTPWHTDPAEWDLVEYVVTACGSDVTRCLSFAYHDPIAFASLL